MNKYFTNSLWRAWNNLGDTCKNNGRIRKRRIKAIITKADETEECTAAFRKLDTKSTLKTEINLNSKSHIKYKKR